MTLIFSTTLGKSGFIPCLEGASFFYNEGHNKMHSMGIRSVSPLDLFHKNGYYFYGFLTAEKGDKMSKKSRERREKNKATPPNDYFSSDALEMARFGENTIVRNNRTPEQQATLMEYLCAEYPAHYESISNKINALKEEVMRCNPYTLLMYLRIEAISAQLNIFSESELSSHANAIVRAQEYIQSILVSTKNTYNPFETGESQENIYKQIVRDFEYLYNDFSSFYLFWAAYTEKTTGISGLRLNDIIEAQYMYWVRGNRYPVFELEPLKKLLPPHDAVLQELFGVSANEIINGLKKLQYSLSQGCADAIKEFGDECNSFINSTDLGAGSETVILSAKNRVLSLVKKVFGDGLIDIENITGWDTRFIDALSLEIGEYNTFWGDNEFSGWPIVELPVMRKPFIKINGTAYSFLYYALFDNIYRIIQKNILSRKPNYLESWKQCQTRASEEMVRDLFLKLLPGADAHIGNYYPVKTSLKQMNENDIIVVFQNHLFIVEVKAGSFPNTPPITDFDAHISAYHSLAEVADSQCSRTLDYIKAHPNAQFYSKEKVPTFSLPNLASFDDVYTFSVTVDNFNEFAAKAEKSSVISLKQQTIVLSYDDLLVYAEYFDSPTRFLHYLKQRKAAMSVPQFQMYDEFDHLGLYINRNLYAMNPTQYNDVHNVLYLGFRKELDRYFSLLYVASQKVVKPVQEIQSELLEILNWLDKNISPENIKLAHYLLNLSIDAKKDFSEKIRYALRRQRELNHSIPIVAFGKIKYCLFISVENIPQYSSVHQHDYVYAVASRNEAIPVMWISLEYDKNNKLTNAKGQQCLFSDIQPDDVDRIKVLGQEKARDWIELAERKNGRIGRNDYCPCGSGKKYKFCCLRAK